MLVCGSVAIVVDAVAIGVDRRADQRVAAVDLLAAHAGNMTCIARTNTGNRTNPEALVREGETETLIGAS